MAKLKGQGFKQLFIEHGEKLVCVLVGLFVLFALATSNWATYDKSPDEFTAAIDNGKRLIQTAVWPEEQRQEVSSKPDVHTLVIEGSSSPLEVAPYDFAGLWNDLPYQQAAPAMDSDLLSPYAPVVRAAYLFASVAITEETEDEETTGLEGETEETAGEDEPEDSEFGRKNTGTGSPGSSGDFDASSFDPSEGFAEDEDEDEDMGFDFEDSEGSESMMASNVEGRGLRYVAVRMLVPVRKQLEKLMKAQNLRTREEAAQYLNYVDFILERQTAVDGPDPWAGKWEPVDIEVAVEVLNSATAFEPDVVETRYINDVFTQPLVMRLVGNWGATASHPELKLLSEKRREEERLFNEKAMQDDEARKSSLQGGAKRSGFSGVQHDISSIRGGAFGGSGGMEEGYGDSGEMESMFDEIESSMTESYGSSYSGGPGMQQRAGQMSAEVLLFRYFDFDVEPGVGYRYRAKLVVENPNFDRPLEEVYEESVAQGELRTTPPSEPTKPVWVPHDTRSFLSFVKANRSSKALTATMDVFSWYADAGMPVRARLEVVPGQLIGGQVKTEVIRPDKQTFEMEDIQLTGSDLMIDIAGSTMILQGEHVDLNFKRASGARSRGQVSIGTADQVLIADEYGDLRVESSTSAVAEHRKEATRYKNLAESFDDLRVSDEEPEDDLESYGDEMSSEDMMDAYGGRSSSSTRKKSRGSSRRGSGRSRSSGRSSGSADPC
ncbi:MAG: hypothetical protein CMJ48_10530 [Planctomycetaceae bacterium]|nr:hypothetical protein [Planctomycetaceae bacterium]